MEDIFIQLHRTKIAANKEPMFDPILVNIKEIIAVEPTGHEGCGAEVYIKDIKTQMRFRPLYCREHYKDILALLKEKGVEITAP